MSGATILLVDANPANLSVLRALLSKDNHELIAANTGHAAVDLLRENPTFDLVVLDAALPDVDGISVCRQLKQDTSTKHIPIILISDVRDDDGIVQALAAGADGYLVRPIEDVALRAWVRATLRISRLQRELAQTTPRTLQSHTEILGMFARLAHQVNNPLQALYAAADMLSLNLPEGSENRSLVTDVLTQAERVAQIVATASKLAKDQLGD